MHPGLHLQSSVLKSMEIPIDLDKVDSEIADNNKHIHSVKNLGTTKSPFSLFE